MKTPTIEEIITTIVRKELARYLGVEPEQVDEAAEDDLRERVAQRAAAMRAKRRAQ